MSRQKDSKYLPIWIQFFRAAYQGHTAGISNSVADIAALSKVEMKFFFRYSVHFWYSDQDE